MIERAGTLFLLSLLGCSSSGAQPADAPHGKNAQGSSAGNPVMTCGPGESYEYVASRYRCADGSNPFGGDAERAADARQGSQQSPSSNHLIDAYEVPCAAGAEIVYVDLYGCPEYEKRLEQLSGAMNDPTQRFSAGDFASVIEECRSLADDASHELRAWCAALVPASLYALGRDNEGLSFIGDVCRRMPPASAENDARASLIALVMGALFEARSNGHFKREEAQVAGLLPGFLQACQVSEDDVKRAVESMRQGT